MIEDVLLSAEKKMEASIEALKRELSGLRTGRASPALIEHINVDYAGASMPLKHIASISASGANMLIIQPWDPISIQSIEKAIFKSNLGLTPNIDNNIIRLNIPPLTEERRLELIKLVKSRVEEGRIAIRNLRREAIDKLKQLEKDKEISQDDHKRTLNKMQTLTDGFIDIAEQAGQKKEAELIEV